MPQYSTDERPDMLLDWRTVQTKMPWDVVLLLGGGFALAESTEVCYEMYLVNCSKLRFKQILSLQKKGTG